MVERRRSKQREAIYEMLCSTKSHPSAEWVYEQLKPNMPNLSLATVYRNINLFVDEGVAMHVETVNGIDRFDGNALPHPHFICDICESVIDIDEFLLCVDITNEIREAINAIVTGIVVHGLCEHCQEISG